MQNWRWLFLSLMIWGAAAFGQSKISPSLERELDRAATEGGTVKALVLMSDRVDIRALDAQLYEQKVTLQERAYTVITTLQAKAAETQGPVNAFLESRLGTSVMEFQSFWIANMFAVDATPGAIYELSDRLDIRYLTLDSELQLEEVVDSAPASPTSPNGTEPGLLAINAQMMWQAGYTGDGVIVMGVDTGVDANHPALSWKWRGTHVPTNQAWFDPDGGSTFPNDCDSHGSHTVGTMTGLDPATSDTIGVAPGAEWIAAKTICSSSHTSRSIAAFQWAVDPDGNPGTADDMPVGIGNSWWDPDIVSSTQCDPSVNPYIDVVTAVEAAGIAIVFSAGNSGPGSTSITQPKNVNFDLVDFWATGAVDGNSAGFPIASFSSRGPVVSSCSTGNTSLDIKPEASAPGVNVRSAVLSGGYGTKSGTSMACPHVVGALALLRQAHPTRTGRELKLALYQTARDLGTPGEDNDYGMGLIDVWAAHLSLADPLDPERVTNLEAYSDYTTPTSIGLSWEDPTHYAGGDTLLPGSFTVEISRDGSAVASVAGGVQTYTDNGLTDGQTYLYNVVVKDVNDSLSSEVEVSWTAGGAVTPSAPMGL
ncbi:MAG: S8 family serine peptidase, partial [Calditrichaeota bacterium]|nr:S8 family serine peptidase [Calditrichota bacterium]